jgi:hypothetical protein
MQRHLVVAWRLGRKIPKLGIYKNREVVPPCVEMSKIQYCFMVYEKKGVSIRSGSSHCHVITPGHSSPQRTPLTPVKQCDVRAGAGKGASTYINSLPPIARRFIGDEPCSRQKTNGEQSRGRR